MNRSRRSFFFVVPFLSLAYWVVLSRSRALFPCALSHYRFEGKILTLASWGIFAPPAAKSCHSRQGKRENNCAKNKWNNEKHISCNGFRIVFESSTSFARRGRGISSRLDASNGGVFLSKQQHNRGVGIDDSGVIRWERTAREGLSDF